MVYKLWKAQSLKPGTYIRTAAFKHGQTKIMSKSFLEFLTIAEIGSRIGRVLNGSKRQKVLLTTLEWNEVYLMYLENINTTASIRSLPHLPNCGG